MMKNTVSQKALPLDGIGKLPSKTIKQPITTPYHLGEGILIGKDWKITSDHFNVILWKLEGRDKPRWRTEGYFSTLGSCLNGLVQQGVRDTELTDLRTVVEKIEELKVAIFKMAAGK